MKKKSWLIVVSFLAIYLIVTIVVICVNSKYTNLTKEDLIFARAEFSYYEKIPEGKSADKFVIYTKDNRQFGFPSVITIDEDLFYDLKEDDVLDIYYINTNKKNLENQAIEIYHDDKAIFNLTDYHIDYRNINITFICVFIGISLIGIIYTAIINKIGSRLQPSNPKKINYSSEKNLKVYEDFKQRIKFDDYIYTANFNKCFERPENIYILCKLFLDTLKENEIRIIYDADAKDEVGYFVFKSNNKIMFAMVFIAEDNIHEINEFEISWTYPNYQTLSKEELKIFNNQLRYYSATHKVEFRIEEE